MSGPNVRPAAGGEVGAGRVGGVSVADTLGVVWLRVDTDLGDFQAFGRGGGVSAEGRARAGGSVFGGALGSGSSVGCRRDGGVACAVVDAAARGGVDGVDGGEANDVDDDPSAQIRAGVG